MSEVSRREAFRTLAVGAAGATVAAGLTGAGARGATGAVGSSGSGSMLPPGVREGAAEAARRLGRRVERREGMRSAEAQVLQCRSWDGQVYLYVDEAVRGFVPVNALGMSIAGACQAAGRPVAVSYWGHDAGWGDGVGRFEGAILAVDGRDLPEAPTLG